MVNMIVVDDELLIRKGLAHIPWETVGVHLVGTATCGMDALELLKEHSIQILFTDIQMPDISGLELIRAANLLVPDIQSVLLTGHNNFTYAKEAISLHVYDYILKPCDPEEVLAIIGKLAKKIEAERQFRQKINNNVQKLRQETLEAALTEILINHSESPNEFEVLENAGFHDGTTCQIVSGITKDFRTLKNISTFLPATPVNLSLSVLCPSKHSFIFVFFTNHTNINLLHHAFQLLSELKRNILNKENIILRLGIGKEITSWSHLPDAYRTSQVCMDLFFSHPNSDFICYQDIISSLDTENPEKICNKIIAQIEQKNYATAKEYLEELESYYRTVWITSPKIKLSVIDMCLLAAQLVAKKKNAHFSGLSAEQLLDINQSQSLSELFCFTWKTLKHCIDNLNALSEPPLHYIVNDCLHYIENHYNEDINLKIVAEGIHVNADYLSRILKKEYGSPFVQILTNHRLEKACALLSDNNLSISTVANLTGFRDFRYFGQVFKNKYKMTPSEYRKNAINFKTK